MTGPLERLVNDIVTCAGRRRRETPEQVARIAVEEMFTDLRTGFAIEMFAGGSSNDVVQWLDAYLTERGQPTVLYS